jgi:hypothetical protein
MKKLFVVIVVAGAIFFSITHFDLFANTYVNEEQILNLLDERTVIVSEGQIYNLALMEEFYQNSHWEIESEMYLFIDPYTAHSRKYLLQFVEGRILLSTSIEENRAYNDIVGEYARLFRIYKDREIQYVLECFDRVEYVLFGHRTS